MTTAIVSVGARALVESRLEDTLVGDLGAAGVREVVLDPQAFGLGELAALSAPSGSVAPMTLIRTKFKPDRKLTAYYHLCRDGLQPLPLAVTWSLAAGVAGSRAVNVAVLQYPADPAMQQLERLTPARLSRILTSLTGPPAWLPGAITTDVVRYQPGQRHVLHVRGRAQDLGVFVKLDREDSGVLAMSVAATMGPVLAAAGVGALVEPLGYLRRSRAAFWRAAPGELLTRQLAVADDAATGRIMELVGRTLRAFHEGPRTGDVPDWWPALRRGDVVHEVAGTLRAGEHFRHLLPVVGRRWEHAVQAVADTLAQPANERAVLAHGDFKADNVLVHQEQVRLLDLDRVRLAEPAMDLGKMLSDVRWWGGGDETRVQGLQAAFAAGYGPCASVTWRRARMFETLYRLKAVARRLPVHAAAWTDDVEQAIASTAWPPVVGGRPS